MSLHSLPHSSDLGGSNFDYSMEMGDLEQKEGSAERKDW